MTGMGHYPTFVQPLQAELRLLAAVFASPAERIRNRVSRSQRPAAAAMPPRPFPTIGTDRGSPPLARAGFSVAPFRG